MKIWTKKLAAGVIAAALIAGAGASSASAAPTLASGSDSSQQAVKIYGKVTTGTSKKPVKITKYGYSKQSPFRVWTADCKSVKGWKSSTKNGRYSITLPKSGSYRVSNHSAGTVGATWGAEGPSCKKAKVVKAKKGKTRHNLKMTANGSLSVSGDGYYAIYDRAGKREIDWLFPKSMENPVKPGSYQIVKNNSKGKVVAVLGTTSKKPSQGRTIVVHEGKATAVNFKTGKAKLLKSFSAKTSVKVSGEASVGSKLKASVTNLPKGSKVKYEWYLLKDDGEEAPIHGAKKSTYKVKKGDRGGTLSAIAVAAKSGYSKRIVGSDRQLDIRK